MVDVLEGLSLWMIPLVLLLIPLVGFGRKVKVYEAFVEGAGEGFQTAIRIMPFLVAIMVAVNVFRASGAMGALVAVLSPLISSLDVPPELIPLAIMRPLSGTGALGMTTELLQTYGPDSLIGLIASTVLGSTDTTFYVLTVYFGAVGIMKPRYAVFVGLSGDLIGFFASLFICRLLFLN